MLLLRRAIAILLFWGCFSPMNASSAVFDGPDDWMLERIPHSAVWTEIRLLKIGSSPAVSWRARVPMVNQEAKGTASFSRGSLHFEGYEFHLHETDDRLIVEVESAPDGFDPSGHYFYREQQPETTQEKSRTELELVDGELNRIYQQVMASLGSEEQTVLRDSERAWIDYKEFILEGPSFQNVDEVEKNVFETGITRERIEFLRHYTGERVDPGVEGTWEDEFGGVLSIRVLEDGEWEFAIRVIRGPTFHFGMIRGVVVPQWEGEAQVATFSDPDEEMWMRGKPATLQFQRTGHILEVMGKNTQSYHGARAYFDGKYFKVTELVEDFFEEG